MFYDPAAAFLVGFSNLDRICSSRVRINALIGPNYKVLDSGTGQAGISKIERIYSLSLHDILSKILEYNGVDVDEARSPSCGTEPAAGECWRH
jgi:hypothetical protein